MEIIIIKAAWIVNCIIYAMQFNWKIFKHPRNAMTNDPSMKSIMKLQIAIV